MGAAATLPGPAAGVRPRLTAGQNQIVCVALFAMVATARCLEMAKDEEAAGGAVPCASARAVEDARARFLEPVALVRSWFATAHSPVAGE
eukprot:3224907-Prymnesium_polylepis.1